MIDTHCHLTFDVFEDRQDDVVADAIAAGVRGMISVATTSDDATRAAALADRFPNVWCTAGWHPLYADQPCNWDDLRRAAAHPKCVAWGELGLDNHYDKPPRALQDRVLAEELAFIESCADDGLDKPVIVHCRESFDDLLAAFRDAPLDPARFVFHCFTGTPDDARRVLDFGAWISFTGVVTFKNAKEVADAAKLVPADRIMVETDAPFLTPAPHRKIWPNEPKYVVHTAQFLADLRGIDPADLEAQLDANAERFFGIELPPPAA
ncbi:MAG: TatD family hydrolase [Planctomycetota bacterium]|jgi:TatD DNase family protein